MLWVKVYMLAPWRGSTMCSTIAQASWYEIVALGVSNTCTAGAENIPVIHHSCGAAHSALLLHINNAYVIAGEPITMVALGGSITCGAGGRDVPSYIEQVFQWINATFPHPEHTFINSCKVCRLLHLCPPTFPTMSCMKCTQMFASLSSPE